MWILALRALLNDRGKLVTAVLGVMFSVVLANVQGGLLLGLLQKASILVDFGGADIWIGPRHTNNVDMGTFIPERWLHRVRGVAGVARADPYLIASSQARMPDGRFEVVAIIGCEPGSPLGGPSAMDQGDRQAFWHTPDGVLIDVSDAANLGDVRLGEVREINHRQARVVGMTRGTVGFTNCAYVFTTLHRARTRYTQGVPPEHCSFFLVQAEPGTDVRRLSARLREEVPSLDVHDRESYSRVCMWFWLTRTGVGISFGLATLLGLMVGLSVVAMTLYASVTERIKEFGTLKALGASDRLVGHFLLVQALGSGVIGSSLGVALAVVISLAISNPRAPVVLTLPVAALSVLLMLTVCLIAAWLPYARIRRIDPASVLRN